MSVEGRLLNCNNKARVTTSLNLVMGNVSKCTLEPDLHQAYMHQCRREAAFEEWQLSMQKHNLLGILGKVITFIHTLAGNPLHGQVMFV